MSNKNNKKSSNTLRFYAELLIPGLLFSISGYFLWNKVLFPLFFNLNISNAILISGFFFIITAMYLMVVGIIEFLSGRVYPSYNPLTIRRILIVCFLGSFVVSCVAGLLEIIYEIDIKKEVIEPSNEVVFLVDDSGSMGMKNDRYCRRIDALESMVDKMDNTVMVGLVRFSTEVNTVVPLRYLDNEQKEVIKEYAYRTSNGKTNIGDALEKGVDLFTTSGSNENATKSMLLFTDGKATSSYDKSLIISKCREKGVIINIISLGYDTDRAAMNELTEGTGGHLMTIPDDEYIQAAYDVLVAGKNLKRCLLVPTVMNEDRTITRFIMRVLFLSIIGLLSSIFADYMIYYQPFINKHLIYSPLMIIVSALLLTIGNANDNLILIFLISLLFPFFSCLKKANKKRYRKKREKDNIYLNVWNCSNINNPTNKWGNVNTF